MIDMDFIKQKILRDVEEYDKNYLQNIKKLKRHIDRVIESGGDRFGNKRSNYRFRICNNIIKITNKSNDFSVYISRGEYISIKIPFYLLLSRLNQRRSLDEYVKQYNRGGTGDVQMV